MIEIAKIILDAFVKQFEQFILQQLTGLSINPFRWVNLERNIKPRRVFAIYGNKQY